MGGNCNLPGSKGKMLNGGPPALREGTLILQSQEERYNGWGTCSKGGNFKGSRAVCSGGGVRVGGGGGIMALS